ncbi:MAG: DNA topoisomerase VI subunit B [Bdellovibrionaceae bacterium]|nr:DNA topoisomerase VI subunit B [Pseudobdellovibrionaceae bacterium]
MSSKITTSSTAEYFAKNLQQVGFSSPLKAVLTTLKEAVDNSLDACEDEGIAPEITVQIKKVGKGSSKSADLIVVTVEDNGPGLDETLLPKVFGEYLASSKFGRGQCSRGQQGIGISAATTWAQLTNAQGVKVISKTKKMRKAIEAIIDVNIKGNKGVIKNRKSVDWDKPHGLKAEFRIDGRVQLNGDGGILTYLEGTTLVNPHLTLNYKLLDHDWVNIGRVSEFVPQVPKPTLPHPHTMKLGEFMTHAHLFGKLTLKKFLTTGFSRISDATIKDFTKKGLKRAYLSQPLVKFNETDFKEVFRVIQDTDLANPTTRSVLVVGEESLSKSIQRLGDIDFFSVMTRKPKICDFKPVVVEVAIARFLNKSQDAESQGVQLLRFANRVPLQFDKASCAITKAVESVTWRSYGLAQSKNSLPQGPYVIAVSVTSPFIKFKNASKETIDASEELVEEIRRALMQAGQKLGRHIRRENKAADLERKIAYIAKFGPILVDGLARIAKAPKTRRNKAEEGLNKILGKDSKEAENELKQAEDRLTAQKAKQKEKFGDLSIDKDPAVQESKPAVKATTKKAVSKKTTSKVVKKASKKVVKKVAKKTAKKKATKKKVVKKKIAKKKTTKKVKKTILRKKK